MNEFEFWWVIFFFFNQLGKIYWEPKQTGRLKNKNYRENVKQKITGTEGIFLKPENFHAK